MNNAVACRIHSSDGRSLYSQRSHYLLLEIQDFRIAVLFLSLKVHGFEGKMSLAKSYYVSSARTAPAVKGGSRMQA